MSAVAATEIAHLAYAVETGKPDHIVIVDDANGVAQTLDCELARAVAVRLIELAAELPEPPRPIRRGVEVDERLRGLDG